MRLLLLPSGKFSRLALSVAGLLAVLLFAAVAGIRSPATSELFSDLLQLSFLFWAASCSVYVARKSSGYLRQLWTLLASTLFLGTTAQALGIYYELIVQAPRLTPWPSDILFVLWVMPAIMMLVPRPAESSTGLDWLQVLDYAQVGIVALTAYLYFFYIPSRWEAEGGQVIRQMYWILVLRDAGLSAGFLVRRATVSSSSVRSFLARMAGFFLATGATELGYLLVPGALQGKVSWADFIWCTPYLLVAVFAATWKSAGEATVPKASSSLRGMLISQALPVSIPLLVLFMSRRLAVEQLTLAWVAVTCSFLVSAARSVLTNVKQRRILDTLLQAEQALARSERMFSTAFRSSPDAVSIVLLSEERFIEVNDGFSLLTGYSRQEAVGKTSRELNLWVDTAHRAAVLARLREKGQVLGEEFQTRTKQGEIRIGQYSASVIELDGRPCILSIVHDLTARKKVEDALRISEQRFRTLVENLQVGVVSYGPGGEIEFANAAAQVFYGMTLEEVRGKKASELGITLIREDGTEIPYPMLPVPRVLATRQPVQNEVVGWHRAGSDDVRWRLGSALPQFARDGSVSSVIASFTDITERRRAERVLRQLSTRLLQLQDEERRRLGRELHDSLAQSVLAVNLYLAQAMGGSATLDETTRRALSEARRVLQEMSREIRTLSYLLHPPVLDELGLASAIKEYSQGFGERSGITIEMELQAGFERLPQESETALFRIVQESLTNIQRHSGSEWARIRLRGDATRVDLEIADRGQGMAKSNIEDGDRRQVRFGVGILGMRERMTQLGGKLEIESSPAGTIVRASIPVTSEVSNASAHPDR